MNSSYISYLLVLMLSMVCLCHYVAAGDSSKTNGLAWKPKYSYKEINMDDNGIKDVTKPEPKSGSPKPKAAPGNAPQPKCKDGEDVCSTVKSTMDSYLETIKKNIEAFQQLNKNVEELMKKLSEKTTDCGEEKDGEQKDGEKKDGEKKDDEQKDGEKKDGEQKDGEQKDAEAEPAAKPAPKEKTPTTPTKAPVPQRITPSKLASDAATPKTKTQAPPSPTEASPIVADDTESPEPSNADTNPVYRTYVGQENEEVMLKCDEKKGHVLYIIDAYYGPSDANKCPTSKGPFTRKTGDRYDKVRTLCGQWSKSTCSFKVDSAELGDICKGVPKKLRVSYYCSAPGVMGLRRKPSILL